MNAKEEIKNFNHFIYAIGFILLLSFMSNDGEKPNKNPDSNKEAYEMIAANVSNDFTFLNL